MRDVVKRAEQFSESPLAPDDVVLQQGPETALFQTQHEQEWLEVDSKSLMDLEVVR